jgi:hypothetical protein
MRNKITIALNILALVIGTLALFQGWGRVSQVLIFTACAMILNKNVISQLIVVLLRRIGIPMRLENADEPERSKVIVAFGYMCGAFAITSIALDVWRWTH